MLGRPGFYGLPPVASPMLVVAPNKKAAGTTKELAGLEGTALPQPKDLTSITRSLLELQLLMLMAGGTAHVQL